MKAKVRLLDSVALVRDIPKARLRRGQVGTVVEILEPGVFEVEFSDEQGRTYAMETLRESQLLVLRYKAVSAA